MRYVWYVDTFFLMNFWMDSAGLFAAAAICSRRIRIGRVLAVSAFFVAISAGILFWGKNRMLYRLLVHLLLNPAMTAAAFRPKSLMEFLREIGCVYLVFFVTGGLQESLFLSAKGAPFARIALSGGICAIWFVIWLIRQKTMRFLCVADLWLDGEKISVEAYCDSGNLLLDPSDHKPVSILKEDALPENWRIEAGAVQTIRYHTLSGPNSGMEVITLDRMDLYIRGCVKRIECPKIALKKGELMQIPGVQMILNHSFL